MIPKIIAAIRQGQLDPIDEDKLEQMVNEFVGGKTLHKIAGLPEEGLAKLYETAYYYFQNRRYSESAQAFWVLCQLNSDSGSYLFGLAASLQMLRQYRGALEIYGLALIKDPQSSAKISFQMAECLIMLGKKTEADKIIAVLDKQNALGQDQKKQLVLAQSRSIALSPNSP